MSGRRFCNSLVSLFERTVGAPMAECVTVQALVWMISVSLGSGVVPVCRAELGLGIRGISRLREFVIATKRIIIISLVRP